MMWPIKGSPNKAGVYFYGISTILNFIVAFIASSLWVFIAGGICLYVTVDGICKIHNYKERNK